MITIVSICNIASIKGHLHILIWTHNKKIDFDTKRICNNATYHNHLHILIWAYNKKIYFDIKTICNIASSKGYSNILQWIIDNKMHFNKESICRIAVYFNRLDILILIKKNFNEFIFDGTISAIAVLRGYFNILKWLHKNGCTWDIYTYLIAIENRYDKCSAYFIENNDSELSKNNDSELSKNNDLLNYLSILSKNDDIKYLFDKFEQVKEIVYTWQSPMGPIDYTRDVTVRIRYNSILSF